MNTDLMKREQLSALADGELQGEELAQDAVLVEVDDLVECGLDLRRLHRARPADATTAAATAAG